jgi:hypothetical protein
VSICNRRLITVVHVGLIALAAKSVWTVIVQLPAFAVVKNAPVVRSAWTMSA